MKILLTGASGFLGKHILNLLQKTGQINTLGRSEALYKVSLDKQIPLLSESYDVVIHAAGKAHSVPKTDQQKQEFYDVNVTGTQNLLTGLTKAPSLPKSFVFISSVAVYGAETGSNISEDAPLAAKDAYGLSKIEAETLITEWCKSRNITCSILRLPLLAGANPPGNLKSMIRGVKKGYYFNIAGGKAKKSMVLANDVAAIIPVVANIGGIYNLTDHYHPNFSELSQLVALQLSKPKPANMPLWFANILAKIGDIAGTKAPINTNKLNKIISDLTFNDDRAIAAFGWQPTPVLKGFKIQ
jgi:nucleoside-diphosphate-sugar epimerase